MAIISICRGTKSGGQSMAECLAEQLHYPLVAREVLQHAASDLGVTEEGLSREWERTPRLWSRRSSEQRLYITAVQAALAEHVAGGDLIYHGRAGQVLLKGLPGVLRLRLIAPISARVRTVMETEGMDEASAEQYIQHVDGVRARWIKTMYGEDIDDPVLYNMVINLRTLSLPAACNIVTKAVQQPDFAVTDDVRTKLLDFRLACRVKLALAKADDTRALDLRIEAHEGELDVFGSAPTLKSGDVGERIVEIAHSVAGVEAVHLQLEWFDPYP
ncbi:MAG: cytidylate kinase family protein [Gemmatimonadales bacterium]